MSAPRIVVELSESDLEQLAERVAELMAESAVPASVPGANRFLTPAEAADYLRCSRQRIYDLCSMGALSRFRDGSRVLVAREEIDAYLRRKATSAS